jgi:hypothetical protein
LQTKNSVLFLADCLNALLAAVKIAWGERNRVTRSSRRKARTGSRHRICRADAERASDRQIIWMLRHEPGADG